MYLKINSTHPNFRAGLPFEGNKNLLKKEEEEKSRRFDSTIGNTSDDVFVRLPNNLVSSSKSCTSYDLNEVEYDDNGNVYSVNGLKTMNFSEITIPIGAAEEKPKTDRKRYSDSVVKQFHDDPHLM